MNLGDFHCYWEQQGRDKLCAVHTLNSLVQAPKFSEVELATIAHALDETERQLLGGAVGVQSNNVDADGNFSLGVMEKALEKLKLRLVNLDRPEIRQQVMKNPQSEQAYICNSHKRAHWYTIRKVRSKWYDLDSLKPSPTFISDFQLSSFLEETVKQGFTLFVVRELSSESEAASKVSLPEPDKFLHQDLLPHQMFLTDRDMDSLRDKFFAEQEKEGIEAQRLAGGGDSGDGDGSTAKAFTMVVPADKRKQPETDWTKLQGGNTLGGTTSAASSSTPQELEMDDDLKAAIAASLGDVQLPTPKDEPTEVLMGTDGTTPLPKNEQPLTVQYRFRSDPPIQRRFLRTSSMKDVFEFIEWANLKENGLPSASGGGPLFSMGSYSLLKAGFPKKEKFVRTNGIGMKVELNAEDVTHSTLTARAFAGKEALTVELA